MYASPQIEGQEVVRRLPGDRMSEVKRPGLRLDDDVQPRQGIEVCLELLRFRVARVGGGEDGSVEAATDDTRHLQCLLEICAEPVDAAEPVGALAVDA